MVNGAHRPLVPAAVRRLACNPGELPRGRPDLSGPETPSVPVGLEAMVRFVAGAFGADVEAGMPLGPAASPRGRHAVPEKGGAMA